MFITYPWYFFLFIITPLAFSIETFDDLDIQQGSLVILSVPKGSEAYLNNKPLKLSVDGDVVFGFGRDAAPSADFKWVLPTGKVLQRKIAIKRRNYDIQAINGIASHYVKKQRSSALLARIKRESAEVKLARRQISYQTAFKQRFIWPIKGKLTGVFGSQRVYNGKAGRPHYGVDLAAPIGTPVKAPADGIIRLAENLYFSGGTLIVDHGLGVTSTFLHLSKLLVEPDQKVQQGQTIGLVGNTGISTGPHLDWRMNWFDERIDPQLLMQDPGNRD